MSDGNSSSRARGSVLAALLLNVGLLLAHVWVFVGSGSLLVLAQGADSLLDIVAGVILTVSATVGMQPRDQNHPFGHQRAEPIGALVTAVLAGVMAFEVARTAIVALVQGSTAVIGSPVILVLAVKCTTKLALLGPLRAQSRRIKSPALRATFVDTRNDVAATLSSLVGVALVRQGYVWADAVLALPIALYIGANGFLLARENLRYLMGEAPDHRVMQELEERARSVTGVQQIGELRAHYVGQELQVEIAILVTDTLSATETHDLGVDVQRALQSHALVSEVFVHLDTAAGKDHET